MENVANKAELMETVLSAIRKMAEKPDTTIEHIEFSRPCVEAFRDAEGKPHKQPGDDIYYHIHLRVNTPQEVIHED